MPACLNCKLCNLGTKKESRNTLRNLNTNFTLFRIELDTHNNNATTWEGEENENISKGIY